jgi:hypothetical protein
MWIGPYAQLYVVDTPHCKDKEVRAQGGDLAKVTQLGSKLKALPRQLTTEPAHHNTHTPHSICMKTPK